MTSFAGLLALCLLAQTAGAWPASGDASPEAKMWRWAETHGAEQVCPRLMPTSPA